jgi:flagellar protein FlgJ
MNLKLDLTPAHLGVSLNPASHLKELKSPAGSVDKSITGKNSPAADADGSKDQAKMKKACQDFEAVFLNYMLSQMRETVPKSGLTGNDPGESIYRGMMDEELSHQMAASGGMGLADMLYRQFTEHGPKIAEVSSSGKEQKANGLG